jgi:hypothetical protein
VTDLDWILVGLVALCTLGGLGSGLVTTLLSFAGLVGGALVGASIAPGLLPDGIESSYTGVIGIGGALLGAALFCALARFVGSFVRGGLRLLPPLKLVDSIGGAVLGAVFGFTLVWAGGAVAMQVTDQPKVRQEVRHSQVLQRLNAIVPPKRFVDIDSGKRPHKPVPRKPAPKPSSSGE